MVSKSRLKKASRSFRLSGLLVSIIKKFSRSNVSVEGLENLRAHPTLFVVNHFTRIETGLLPHLLYQFNGQMVHSLADSSLFVGKFAQYLESVGAFPLDMQGRDEKIISELMRGTHNWIIFPEGSMIKNKKVVEKGRLQLQLHDDIRSPHTGASILALKSFFMKEQYKRAVADNDEQLINYYQETYHLRGPGDLSPLDVCIVPVNITYYPLRPGKNLLSTGVQLLVKDLSPELEEELLVEGKLLLHDSDISISFGHAIDLHSFSKPYRRLFAYLLPFISENKKMNWLMALMRHRLTRLFMRRVYRRLSINMDHIVTTALRYVSHKGLAESTFKEMVYLASLKVKEKNNCRVHISLRDEMINLIVDEAYKPYISIMKLVEQEGAATIKNGKLLVDHEKIRKPLSFHRMRIDNTTSVLANEFEVMSDSVAIIKKLVCCSTKKLSSQIVEAVQKRDCSLYEQERMSSFEKGETKSREIGKPRLLIGDKDKPGIVLAHGFLAAPAEMLELAEYLNQQGYGVYLVRLSGHGTHVKEMETVTVQNWSESFKRGFAVISHYHTKVVVGGFSAGALLALLIGATNSACIVAIVAINPALKLSQKSAFFSPMINQWNKVMDKLSLEGGMMKWVENDPTYSDTNYQKIYISALHQLLKLQESCRLCLSDIKVPLLVIQADKDPIVDPSGASEIFDKVNSSDKKIHSLPYDYHHIIRGENTALVFQQVNDFLQTL